MMMRAWWLAALLPLFAQGVGPRAEVSFDAAMDCYRSGDHQRAFDAFSALVDAAGRAPCAEARLNGALSALHLLRSRDAEELVAPLTEAGGWRAAMPKTNAASGRWAQPSSRTRSRWRG